MLICRFLIKPDRASKLEVQNRQQGPLRPQNLDSNLLALLTVVSHRQFPRLTVLRLNFADGLVHPRAWVRPSMDGNPELEDCARSDVSAISFWEQRCRPPSLVVQRVAEV